MKIVIVEDEHLAAEKLERYIQKYNSNVSVLIKLSSIVDAVTWFEKGIDYDVAFMDIQLTDGLSFEIFNQVKITKPVIFTTAFDEYAIDAFKVNSIDYLLKPITFTDVSKAMVKLKTMESLFVNEEAINKVKNSVTKLKTKDRFLVRLGNHIHSIKTTDILLFYAEGRTVYLVTKENKKYILDYKLEDLIKVLEPSEFFRVNRTFIVSLNGVEDVIVYSNSRLKITPKVNVEKEIIVSREKVSAFKSWFEGN
ncbi:MULTISPECIES: LytR/AlgR family response regulator transcription factor [unclassified Tenacibaculum]|uniref:LytR/AlgR family response regulator transcription factor n=1 Tax=unclassified Tenacibaculum TaxID=2635139 RepID=UPI001F3FDB0A|nr:MULTISPECIES: LytTR family DNA-binding domain-containing protein [unclassified Tenacibaculum]MCF2875103.1 LytTR family DNA-binding domain-containing protein [Tenacibaculum sp. Cn5-1]MCF2935179.1 LytTR family DNA-binding domain-containing protein [Tenacibaculum sp. Cn5-34]MCG7511379.1 LytTR family DNA-binding domain-containing protein [Tenacibaculum sp. Cn5-46]